MTVTPRYALPSPVPTDPADVPTDMTELAAAVEAALGPVDDFAHSETAALDSRIDSLEAGSALAVIDAAGDLIVGTGPDAAARLPAGVNGQVLVVDTALANKLKWLTLGTLQITRGRNTFVDGGPRVVTHGLPTTPLAVVVSPIADIWQGGDNFHWWISAITATTFTVNGAKAKNDFGISPGDFYWMAA